jgi:hypothetical protein
MNMNNKYRHTQTGWLIIYVFLFILAGCLLIYKGYNPDLFPILMIILICLALFYSLTATISEKFLEIRFGVGLIRKRFPLKDIASCRSVKNSWFYGWGIHMTPHGWLYNVSGLDAVEITTKSGKKYRIGTDVPLELEQALHSVLSFK